MYILFFLLLVLLFVGATVYAWYRLRKELFTHVSAAKDIPFDFDLPFEENTLTTKDGITLDSWYIPVENPKAFVILLHGRLTKNGGKARMLSHAQYLYKEGYATMLIDMRGVGKSSGDKVTLGVTEWQDGVAAYDFVKDLPEAKNKKIGFLGISMGAAVSLITVGKSGKGDFIVASVPYASYGSAFGYQVRKEKLFPLFFFTWALQVAALFILGPFYEFISPIALISNIHAPLLLFSAKDDMSVDAKDAWKLYERANKPKEYWEFDTPHDIYTAKKEEFETKVLTFLQTYAQ